MSIVNETRILKGRDGWEARSRVKLDDFGLPGRILEITTEKWPTGGIWSYVICARYERGAKIWEMYGDFQKTMAREPKMRCTEKNVREMHERSLSVIEDLVNECVAFYIKKEAA